MKPKHKTLTSIVLLVESEVKSSDSFGQKLDVHDFFNLTGGFEIDILFVFWVIFLPTAMYCSTVKYVLFYNFRISCSLKREKMMTINDESNGEQTALNQ